VVVRSQRVRAGARYATPSTAWRAAAAAGDLAGAWAALGPEGARREAQTGNAEERTLLADIAAAGEDLPLAVSLLEEVVASAAPAAERAVAAYDLGLRLLEQGRPARAAGSFEEALALGLPATLTPDARARAAESWLKAGDAGRARRWLEAVEQTP
jgi:tetratricopeptide (TPR) repeat protein